MADNKKIAEQVLAAVGGAANLKDATHCMTRLRLYLKDDSLPKDDEVKKISGGSVVWWVNVGFYFVIFCIFSICPAT